MKAYFCILALCFGLTTQAAEIVSWADLETNETVVLEHDLKVNDSFTLKAGTELLVREMENLEQIDVEVFTFKILNLDEVTPVEMTILDQAYGLEVNSFGVADFYVETKDLFAQSYFSHKESQ